MRTIVTAACAAASLLLGGCTVDLVSRYDAATDEAAAAMQKDATAFFVRIASADTPAELSFAANQDFYRREVVALSALRLRAGNIPDNDLTSGQITQFTYNLAYLALLHKGCVTAPLDDAKRALVDAHGVDTSLGCRRAYGADVDDSARGDRALNPAFIPPIQSAFDQSLGAIMKLEMAKKRGASGATK